MGSDETICCTGSHSCETVNFESHEVFEFNTNGTMNSSDTFGIGIRCDGFESCEEATFQRDTMDINDHGDAICTDRS